MAFGINISRQPLKGFYVGSSLLCLWLVRVPYWTFRNLLPSWRPRSSWSISRCIRVNLLRYLTSLSGRVGGLGKNPDHRALEFGKGVEGLYVDGVPELITGDVKKWAESAGVEATRIPGYWQHKPDSHMIMGEKPRQNEKVVYFFHGGGYVSLSAHPSAPTSTIPRSIVAHTPSLLRAFAIEYRLASSGANPFPSQLVDALAGYSYLVHTVGFIPENIILVGDSAGGNLALALTRYLVVYAGSLDRLPAPPGELVLLSPWSDLSGSHDTPGSAVFAHAASDFIGPPPKEGVDFAPSVLAGPHGLDFLANEYISPASQKLESVSFKGFPRTFISIGDAEILVDQINTLRGRMVAELGEDQVETLVSKDAFHDFVGFEWFEPQREETLMAIGSWIERL